MPPEAHLQTTRCANVRTGQGPKAHRQTGAFAVSGPAKVPKPINRPAHAARLDRPRFPSSLGQNISCAFRGPSTDWRARHVRTGQGFRESWAVGSLAPGYVLGMQRSALADHRPLAHSGEPTLKPSTSGAGTPRRGREKSCPWHSDAPEHSGCTGGSAGRLAGRNPGCSSGVPCGAHTTGRSPGWRPLPAASERSTRWEPTWRTCESWASPGSTASPAHPTSSYDPGLT